jgi:hypothetical protein
LLQEALEASNRAVPVLANEPLITRTREYLGDSFERLGSNPFALSEELRHDSLLLQMFIKAEIRLLEDIGISSITLSQVVGQLIDAINVGPDVEISDLDERFRRLGEELQADLDAIRLNEERRGVESRIAGVLGVLGGSLVVAADGGAAIASHGLAAGAAAASISFGSAMVGRALDDVLA